ncbi:hypothetical protein ACLOJK_000736 [Asimina triloba]
MEEQDSMRIILVIWRGKHLNVEIDSNSTFKEFGCKLQRLTNVKPETMRLLVPRSTDKGSRLVTPFSEEHSSLCLQEAAIVEGKPIRMMGVFEDEIEEVNSRKPDLRIAGFEEEEKRLRQLAGPRTSLKLPQGSYIFCDFRTLHIPGIELNPPASEALKIMHRLASDPGIVAIMNKNHGEEISLRLRTDDLKGFRKYESVKQTLLHELAHMVYSEHDADFYAFNTQYRPIFKTISLKEWPEIGELVCPNLEKFGQNPLKVELYKISCVDSGYWPFGLAVSNVIDAIMSPLSQEASSLDWTKGTSHTLSGFQHADHYEEEEPHVRTLSGGERLGGRPQNLYSDARASSVAAAFWRLLNADVNSLKMNGIDKQMHAEPNPDSESALETEPECDHISAGVAKADVCHTNDSRSEHGKLSGSGQGDCLVNGNRDSGNLMEIDRIPNCRLSSQKDFKEPDPDDSLEDRGRMVGPDANVTPAVAAESYENQWKMGDHQFLEKAHEELNAACCKREEATLKFGNSMEPEPDDLPPNEVRAKMDLDNNMGCLRHNEPATQGSDRSGMQTDEPDADASIVNVPSNAGVTKSNDPSSSNDPELQRIHDPVTEICLRLQRAIQLLKSEASPMEVISALQMLSKIIG